MTRPTRTFALLILAVLVVTPAVATVSVAQADSAQGGQVASEYGLSLEELRDSGTQISEEYPSVRQVGNEGFWMVRYPPSGVNSFGGPNKEFIDDSSTIRRQKVRLYTGDLGKMGDNLTLKAAYWSTGQQTVQQGNTTTTRTVARVYDVETLDLQFKGDFRPFIDVPVKAFYDGPVRVTFWVPGNDDLRWTAQVNTIATAQPVNIGSQSELQNYLLLWIVLPGFVSVLAGQGIGSWLRREGGAGPNKRATMIGGGLIAAGVMWLFGYVQFASFIAAFPLAWALALGWASFAYALDEDSTVRKVGFIALDTREIPSPLEEVVSGEDSELNDEEMSKVLDAVGAQIKSRDVIEMPDGNEAIYQPGFESFYARLQGKYTRLDVQNRKARIECTEGSDYDELVIVDTLEDISADDVVNHTPEQVITAWPWKTFKPDVADDENLSESDLQKMSALPRELSTSNYVESAAVIGVGLAATYASTQFLGSWIWGVGAYVPLRIYYSRPVKGYANTKVANGLARSAWATAFYLEITMARFGSVKDLARRLISKEKEEKNLQHALQDLSDEETITQQSASRDSDLPMGSDFLDDDPATGGRRDRGSTEADD